VLRNSLLALSLALSAAYGQEFKVGGKVGDFKLQDLAGKEVTLGQLKGDVTVVTFVSVQCPISNDYNERMKAIYQAYQGKVNFVFVNSNHTEAAPAVAEHAKQVGFAFPVYKDVGNVVADRFGATVTPESFVIDKSGTIVYHGSIDDARNPARVTNPALRDAIEAVKAGKAVAQAETKAFGCTIKRKRSS
jgi:peroxiredoxin